MLWKLTCRNEQFSNTDVVIRDKHNLKFNKEKQIEHSCLDIEWNLLQAIDLKYI